MTVHITVDNTDPRGFQKALSKFKTAVKKSGVLTDLKKYEHYTAPSKAKRVKREKAAKTRRQAEQRARKKDRKE